MEQDIVDRKTVLQTAISDHYSTSLLVPNLVNLVHKWRKWVRSFNPPKINFFGRSYLRG